MRRGVIKTLLTSFSFFFFLMEFFLLFSFSVLEKIIVQGYKALGLQYFFTAGPDEVKAWTIQVTEKKKMSILYF